MFDGLAEIGLAYLAGTFSEIVTTSSMATLIGSQKGCISLELLLFIIPL